MYATRAATVVLFSVVRGRPKAEVLLSAENQNRNRKSIVSGPKSSASLMSACQGPQATVPDADVVSADSAAQLHRLSLHSLSVHNEANDSLRLAHSLPPQLKLCTILSATTEFANCSTPKPRKCTECGTTAFGRNRMSAERAHLSTFGAETETEIQSTSID